jgi:hypothetical protein
MLLLILLNVAFYPEILGGERYVLKRKTQNKKENGLDDKTIFFEDLTFSGFLMFHFMTFFTGYISV